MMSLDRVTDAIPIALLSRIKEQTHNRKGSGGQVCYIVISGSDLYGFPSIDSDYDYRGAYAIDTNHLLGMGHPSQNVRMTIDDVEVELFELRKELGLAGFRLSLHLFASSNAMP